MKHLRILAVFISLIILFSGCSHYFNLNGSDQKPAKPQAPVTPAIAILDEPGQFIPEISIHWGSLQEKTSINNLFAIIGVGSLLLILFLYRQVRARGRRKKGIPLDETDLAMLGLAADTLSNLWRRLQQKSRDKIIPLHRKET